MKAGFLPPHRARFGDSVYASLSPHNLPVRRPQTPLHIHLQRTPRAHIEAHYATGALKGRGGRGRTGLRSLKSITCAGVAVFSRVRVAYFSRRTHDMTGTAKVMFGTTSAASKSTSTTYTTPTLMLSTRSWRFTSTGQIFWTSRSFEGTADGVK
ncbi:hypothetical protein MRX96_008125 [Rhipicephalus microplus]